MFNDLKNFLLSEGDLKVYEQILIGVLPTIIILLLTFCFHKIKAFFLKIKQKFLNSKIFTFFRYKKHIKMAKKTGSINYDALFYLKNKKTEGKKLYRFEKKYLEYDEMRSIQYKNNLLEKTGLTEEDLDIMVQDINKSLDSISDINH